MARTKALKRAQEKYEKTNRSGGVVALRLSQEQLDALDSARGYQGRGQYVKAKLLKTLGLDTLPK